MYGTTRRLLVKWRVHPLSFKTGKISVMLLVRGCKHVNLGSEDGFWWAEDLSQGSSAADCKWGCSPASFFALSFLHMCTSSLAFITDFLDVYAGYMCISIKSVAIEWNMPNFQKQIQAACYISTRITHRSQNSSLSFPWEWLKLTCPSQTFQGSLCLKHSGI